MICRGFWAGKLILQWRPRLIAGGVFDRFLEPRNRHSAFWRWPCRRKGPPRRQGYRFGTLKKAFTEYYDVVYFDMAVFEGDQVALNYALQGIRLQRLVFASDYHRILPGQYRYR